jgi:AcrR family transcriptional regulator
VAEARGLRSERTGRRRTPRPDERQRDPERTKQAILGAARTEFAAHGFAGARVGAIADRAGANKQLISYYFDSKEGLYQAVLDEWHQLEARHRESASNLEELVEAYLRANHEQPELARILLWEGLSASAERTPQPPSAEPPFEEDRAQLLDGELSGLADELSPGLVVLALMGAVAAPTMLPHIASRLGGLEPSSDRFLEEYSATLVSIVRRLARDLPDAPE